MKKLFYTICAGLALGLAGCFNVTDEIFLEDSGSGSFQTTMDMSGMKDMLTMLKTMMPDSLKDKSGGMEGMEGLGALDSMQNMWKDLEKIPGISDVKRVKKEEMIFTLSFRFANVNALNAAMSARNKKDSGSITPTGDFFAFKKGQFICLDTTMSGMGDAMNELNKSGNDGDSSGMDLSMMKSMMGDMKYTTIYHMPGKIKDYTNKNAKLSEDGKTITIEIDLTDSEKVQSIRNDIKFK